MPVEAQYAHDLHFTNIAEIWSLIDLIEFISQVQILRLWTFMNFARQRHLYPSSCCNTFVLLRIHRPFLLVTYRDLGANPRARIHIHPVRTRPSPVATQAPRRHPLCRKSLPFECTNVPRP